MAVEKGDWVRHATSGVEGEVIEVRGSRAKVRTAKFSFGTLSTSVNNLRVTTRPQTGLRKGHK